MFEVTDPKDSAVFLCTTVSLTADHRPTKVRNFEFPVEIPARNISFFPKTFPFLAEKTSVALFLVRRYGNLSLIHTHTGTHEVKKKKKNHVGISNEVTQFCRWEQLTAPEAKGLCGRCEM